MSKIVIPENATPDDKLSIIISYLDHMNRRDKLRTAGGFVRSLISIIPIIILVWSAWYFYGHSDELITKITEQAAKQAASMSGVNEEQMKKIQELMQRR